jgi:hypothetical protein
VRGEDVAGGARRGSVPRLREHPELNAVALAASAALALTACGTGRLDMENVERQVKRGVEQQVGIRLKSVECPKDVEIRAGHTFHCRVITTGGDSASVRVTQRDDAGNVSYELVG